MIHNTLTLIGNVKTGLTALCVMSIVVLLRLSTPQDIRCPAPTADVSQSSIFRAAILLIPVRIRTCFAKNADKRTSAEPADILNDPPELPHVNKSGRYVSMCPGNFDNRRIGNQLFNFAAMLHVARLTGRRVAMVSEHPHGWLDEVFHVRITRVESIERELCPCATIGEAKVRVFEQSMTSLPNRTDIVGKSLLVCGWFQSKRYTIGIESQLRRLLRPKPEHSEAVRSFFNSSRPTRWTEKQLIARIGIHVRAGDVMNSIKFWFGYTVPKSPFFELAMANVTRDTTFNTGSNDGIRRYQFFVLSDSIDWVRTTLGITAIGASLNSSSVDVEVTYSVGNTAAFDLVLMSMCDVVIMTTGSYSWWGAWLANSSKTIYYKNWPRPGSPFSYKFNSEDYFPSDWISFEGPYHEF